jgi:RNA polymerase sigma factor (sigma-70 family)
VTSDFSIPQSARKIFAEFYSKNFGRFYNYTLREIRFRSYQGYTKPGVIDVNDVLNEAFLSVAERFDPTFSEEEMARRYFEGIIDKHLNPSGTAFVPIEEPIEPEDIDSTYQEYYQPDEIIKVEDILIDADSIPPERQVEYKEIETLIDKLPAQLPVDWRDAFILSVREGLSISDIASNTDEDIRSAYRRLVKNCHPDHYGKDSAPFLQIQEAYEVLSDPLKKQRYDDSIKKVSRPKEVFKDVTLERLARNKAETFSPQNNYISEVLLERSFNTFSSSFDEIFDYLWNNFSRL